jgi:hypothetical protein
VGLVACASRKRRFLMLSRFLVAVFASVAVCLPGLTATLAADEFPATLRAGDTELVLNGCGARSKSFLQLYLGGLYLTEASSDSAAIIAADEPMAIRIEITSRFVSQAKMVASLNEGFENSTNGNLGPIKKEINQFRQCFSEPIVKGDVFQIVYIPGEGAVVTKNGSEKGVVEGLAFKQALFGIWLSETPADTELKEAMLTATVPGRSASRR